MPFAKHNCSIIALPSLSIEKINLNSAFPLGIGGILSNTISHNYRRYIVLGFGKKKLDRSYRCLIFRSFLLSFLITVAISIPALTLFSGKGILDIAFLLYMVFLEVVTLAISQHFLILRLWRT